MSQISKNEPLRKMLWALLLNETLEYMDVDCQEKSLRNIVASAGYTSARKFSVKKICFNNFVITRIK